jgi:hypothetical protein
MASDISCPNCHQGFGKDKENPRDMTCDNCGEEFKNQYMPFERWTTYMWAILLSKGLVETHYICKNDGMSYIKPKQR